MDDRDYERRSDLLEIGESKHLDSYTLPRDGDAIKFHVIPPIVISAGKYTIMVRKSLIATAGRQADAVSCRVEGDVIYVDPVYNATGQPGY